MEEHERQVDWLERAKEEAIPWQRPESEQHEGMKEGPHGPEWNGMEWNGMNGMDLKTNALTNIILTDITLGCMKLNLLMRSQSCYLRCTITESELVHAYFIQPRKY